MINTTFLQIKFWGKWLLFPGLDLHTRCRYRFLPLFFNSGLINTLDAGCGNGALSYKAYKLGNRVVGVTNDPEQVYRTRAFFTMIGTDSKRLSFEICNLYDLARLNKKFDQIICSETLEHIKCDWLVIQRFYELLHPGGILHLCCPFALHPRHSQSRISSREDGGHTRNGYTIETYKALLQPVGFEIIYSAGLGAPILVKLDSIIRSVRNRVGDLAALPFFILTWPLEVFDYLNPAMPYSLYVQAVKSP